MTVELTESSPLPYAGDVTVLQAWDMLKDNQTAILVDVRTKAEWSFVGLPDLSSLNKQVQTICWVQFPDMAPNSRFMDELNSVQQDASAPILFLCRSGVRSIAAAVAATAAGYPNCYNILGGFEGDFEGNRHRGTSGGWEAEKPQCVQG